MASHVRNQILGPGCANGHRLDQIVAQAVEQLRVETEVEKVTDITKFADYGVLATPGLVIGNATVSSGRVPSVAEVTGFITDAQTAE